MCWSAHTRPRPDLSSGPVCCPVPTLDSAPSTQAPPWTRTPHGRLWSELYDCCQVPHHGALLPPKLSGTENCDLNSLPPWLQKGSPFLFVGFVLSECVSGSVALVFQEKLYKIFDYCNSCFYYSRVSLLCVRFGKLLYNCRTTSLSFSPCIT